MNKTENVAIDYFIEKNMYLRTHWNAYIVLFSREINILAIFVSGFVLFVFFPNISLISTDKQMAKLRG